MSRVLTEGSGEVLGAGAGPSVTRGCALGVAPLTEPRPSRLTTCRRHTEAFCEQTVRDKLHFVQEIRDSKLCGVTHSSLLVWEGQPAKFVIDPKRVYSDFRSTKFAVQLPRRRDQQILQRVEKWFARF